MGDRHPHDDPIALELLRPALERAFLTVRAGARSSPPVDPPPSLRPFLRFTRLRGRALAAIRGAVDADDELRSRVADAVEDGELGPAAELWLERPDGWEDALADLVDEERSSRDRAASDGAEQELLRRVEALEREREELVAERDAAVDEARAARVDAAEERVRRDEAEERVDEVTARIDTLTSRTTNAEERARTAEASLGEERARVRALRLRVEQLEDGATDADRTEPGPPTAARPPAADTAAEVASPDLPLPEIVAGLADAAAGADQLARSLSSLVDAFAPPEAAPDTRPARSAPTRRRRRPLVLPGLREDDDEAVAWLLRVPDVLVLVDGYNVTIPAWPDRPLERQRDRLIDLLSAEVARSGTDIRVVFDGADVDRTARRVRCPVAVEFTDADVEADDRILELAAAEHVDRPVVVVSGDHRVRDGARARGANVVGSDQLLRHLLGAPG